MSGRGNKRPACPLFLLFRPQEEILDPSHSFGMTARSATHCDTIAFSKGFFPFHPALEKFSVTVLLID
jgi:hypothetical protein